VEVAIVGMSIKSTLKNNKRGLDTGSTGIGTIPKFGPLFFAFFYKVKKFYKQGKHTAWDSPMIVSCALDFP
jgi:hypothetical protein